MGMSDVTRILAAIEGGDPRAAEQLLPLVYEELRLIAAEKLARERPGQTLQPTALVHEAYLRLVAPLTPGVDQASPAEGREGTAVHWNSRGHFIAAAAEAMRRILVDNARRKAAVKHGGKRQRVHFSFAEPITQAEPDAVLDLDEALHLLAAEDAEAAQVAQMRIFAGLSTEETAQARGVSRAQAYRQWAYARAWLQARLGDEPKQA
jgi:hypothetical protein